MSHPLPDPKWLNFLIELILKPEVFSILVFMVMFTLLKFAFAVDPVMSLLLAVTIGSVSGVWWDRKWR